MTSKVFGGTISLSNEGSNTMKNKNNYICKTKQVHYCEYCDCKIPIGSKVRTINPKEGNRFWVCNACEWEEIVLPSIDNDYGYDEF